MLTVYDGHFGGSLIVWSYSTLCLHIGMMVTLVAAGSSGLPICILCFTMDIWVKPVQIGKIPFILSTEVEFLSSYTFHLANEAPPEIGGYFILRAESTFMFRFPTSCLAY